MGVSNPPECAIITLVKRPFMRSASIRARCGRALGVIGRQQQVNASTAADPSAGMPCQYTFYQGLPMPPATRISLDKVDGVVARWGVGRAH